LNYDSADSMINLILFFFGREKRAKGVRKSERPKVRGLSIV